MNRKKITNKLFPFIRIILIGLVLSFIGSACIPTQRNSYLFPSIDDEILIETATPYPTREVYEPGTLVDYIAQSGDTLTALAARFNTTELEIRAANPSIPEDATTMPPGMPMQIPIYYRPLWGTDYKILPDSEFINGPSALKFSIENFLLSTPGWFKNFITTVSEVNMNANQVIEWISLNYSVNPRLILALIEYQTQALTSTERINTDEKYFLGFEIPSNQGVYMQISYVVNLLNHYFYEARQGNLITFEHLDGRIENPDPWQNAATVALQVYFSRFLEGEDYLRAIGPDGFIATYQLLFGDPWLIQVDHIPGSLAQPSFLLPFETGKTWAYTGGPHTGWGSLQPFAAIDFAPPSTFSGCVDSDEFVVAIADGVIARSVTGIVVLDLDGDGDERTGWVVFYLHVATKDRVSEGVLLKMGDKIGHPSCEGGLSTGTHIHIARKYNGEWILADGIIPFNLAGWVVKNGSEPYQGWLVKDDQVIVANTNPNRASFITAGN